MVNLKDKPQKPSRCVLRMGQLLTSGYSLLQMMEIKVVPFPWDKDNGQELVI